MIQFLASAFLMARFACHRLDVSHTLCLQLWRNRPVIQVVLEEPAKEREVLITRLDQVFPF